MSFNLSDYTTMDRLIELYGEDRAASQPTRYSRLAQIYKTRFTSVMHGFYSVAGRVEIAGNHTDHERGSVIGASIGQDALACAGRTLGNVITVYGLDMEKTFAVDLSSLDCNKSEEGTTTALIRGMAAAFKSRGYAIGGFDAVVSSDVLVGSGLSSSAAVEGLLGVALNDLYNDNTVDTTTIAIMGQYAENVYFGKPCGLLDQMACITGGVVGMDFIRPDAPIVTPHKITFEDYGYVLCVVNTGGTHANLTDDYAGVTMEMRSVAAHFGKQVLREVEEERFYAHIAELRSKLNDRAVLRAHHYYTEQRRVGLIERALTEKNIPEYLNLVEEAGRSSLEYLQNAYSPANPGEQGITLALALTEKILAGAGAKRLQGGGFAGTIQAYVPVDMLSRYVAEMEKVFGSGSVVFARIRSEKGGPLQ